MKQAWKDRATDIKQAYELGERNLTQLAARFGTSRDTVRRSLIYRGIIPNPALMKRPTVWDTGIIRSYIGPELKSEMEKITPQTFTEARAAARQKADRELAQWERELLNRVPVEPPAEVAKEAERIFVWNDPNPTATFDGVDGAKPKRLKPWEKRVLKLEAQLSDLSDRIKTLEERLPQLTYTHVLPPAGSAMRPGVVYNLTIPGNSPALSMGPATTTTTWVSPSGVVQNGS